MTRTRPGRTLAAGSPGSWPADVLSMPDKWEYPWYAAWDLAFHRVALARLDPELAKHQLTLLCREWYVHPGGQLPAYEWAFGAVNPPVHAWAALRVFEIDGKTDYGFLERIFHKLLINFTWWVNREDAEGNNVFQGGFLGLDNIGPFDRSAQLPAAGRLEQADGTAWMAMYCLNLLEMAHRLACHDPTYEDVATKFFEHFAYIATALNDQGLRDEADGFYYDVLRCSDGTRLPLKARSMVGLIPVFAVCAFGEDIPKRLPDFARRVAWFITHKPGFAAPVAHLQEGVPGCKRLLSVPGPERLRRVLETVLDETEFLSPYGPAVAVHLPPGPFPGDRPWAAAPPGSTTSPPNRPRACSAATPTGAARSGSRSTAWRSRRCAATTSAWATTSPLRSQANAGIALACKTNEPRGGAAGG